MRIMYYWHTILYKTQMYILFDYQIILYHLLFFDIIFILNINTIIKGMENIYPHCFFTYFYFTVHIMYSALFGTAIVT